MVGPEEESEVVAALFARAQAAVERAGRIQQESGVLHEVAQALREGRLSTRCAWCSRYRIDGKWLVVEKVPTIAVHAGVTHSICEDCLTALRESGMSV